MSKVNFREVPETASPRALREYLIYLVDELSYQLRNIDSDNMTGGTDPQNERSGGNG